MVTRLGEAYVRLIEAGDISFLQWNEEFQCDVEAAKANDVQYFAKISQRAEQFELKLQSWETELMEFRRENPLVNNFTVKQILVLRRYLMQYSSLSTDVLPDVNEQVFTLLKKIAKEVTPKKIRNCCQYMYGNIRGKQNKSRKEEKPNTAATAKTDDETNFTRFTYKQLMVMIERFLLEHEDDVERNLVYASLLKVKDFSNEKKVLLWCGKHEDDDEDLIEELSEQAERELERMEQNALR